MLRQNLETCQNIREMIWIIKHRVAKTTTIHSLLKFTEVSRGYPLIISTLRAIGLSRDITNRAHLNTAFNLITSNANVAATT